MANREKLIDTRRKDLLKKGYPPGIVQLAMEWAVGSAEGMANYVMQEELASNDGTEVQAMTTKFLPRYLNDCEKWIQAFGHRPKQ